MNVLITTARDGVLTAHKDTCKKIEGRETQGLEDLLDTNAKGLTTVKKASCCKPSDATIEEIEQAGWDALEAQANFDAGEDEVTVPNGEVEPVDEDEDLIGDTAEDEDLIGELEDEHIAPSSQDGPKAKAAISAATRAAAARDEKREVNGLESLKKVAAHLSIDLGKKPVFPGFGKAFKTAAKQSVYINSKGNADVRATDAAQADEWAELEHIERRAGNYVRVALSAL